MITLIAQREDAADPETGRAYGAELFQDAADGSYAARVHIRTYDGIRVDSAWASDHVRLVAQDKESAWKETWGLVTSLRSSVGDNA